jgi:hypothetical protein
MTSGLATLGSWDSAADYQRSSRSRHVATTGGATHLRTGDRLTTSPSGPLVGSRSGPYTK